MVVTVFRSRLNPEHQEEYFELAPKIAALASNMAGYVSHKSFTADDGERVTIVEFEDNESQQAWAKHPDHLNAMANGRDHLYEYYDIKVCTVDRASLFDRNTATTD